MLISVAAPAPIERLRPAFYNLRRRGARVSGEQQMQINVNGEPREVPAEISLAELVDQLGLTPQRVAVEVNRELVTRKRYAETVLQAGDSLEIVTLVGGG